MEWARGWEAVVSCRAVLSVDCERSALEVPPVLLCVEPLILALPSAVVAVAHGADSQAKQRLTEVEEGLLTSTTTHSTSTSRGPRQATT